MTEEYGTPEKKECNCIAELPKSLKAVISEKLINEDISDLSVILDLAFCIIGNRMFTTTRTEVNISYLKNGKLKKSKQILNHSFCPFCGVKKEVSNG